MKVKSESEVAQSCLTLSDPMDCSLPGSPIAGILQARVLEWDAIAWKHFPRGWSFMGAAVAVDSPGSFPWSLERAGQAFISPCCVHNEIG